MLVVIGSTALAFAFAQRYQFWILLPLTLSASIAIWAVDIHFQRSLLTLILNPLVVAYCIDLGYLLGLVFNAVIHRKRHVPSLLKSHSSAVAIQAAALAPIAAEIDARFAFGDQRHDWPELIAIVGAAMVITPCRLESVTTKICAR
jgi:hypothetical protein